MNTNSFTSACHGFQAHCLKVLMTLATTAVVLTGCQSVNGITAKRDNGSLDYQKSQRLDPIQLPVNQATGSFIPIYVVPNVPENSVNVTNEAGTQYQLPRPMNNVQ